MLSDDSSLPKVQMQLFVNYTKLPGKDHGQYRKLIKSHTSSYNNRRRVKKVKLLPEDAEKVTSQLVVEDIDVIHPSPSELSQRVPSPPCNCTNGGEKNKDEVGVVESSTHFHNIDRGPRNRLPIELEGGRLASLYDYYIHSFGPTYMWRLEVVSGGTPEAVEMFKSSLLQLIMQDSVVFEATMSLCQAQLDWDAAPASNPSKHVLQHYGNVLKGLQQKLKLPKCKTGSALTLTVMGLMSLDHMYGNWRSFEANLKGLRQIIALRGSLDPLGLFGFEEHALASYEVRWEMHVSQTTRARTERQKTALTYLDHPFPPEVCRTVSRLPKGFRELALSRSLSTQLIELLSRVSGRLELESREGHRTGEQGVRATQEAKTCAWLLSLGRISPIEELICIGIIAHMDPFNGQWSSPMRRTGIENHTPKLQTVDIWELSNLHMLECVMWVAMAIATISDSDKVRLPNRWLLLDQIMAEHESARKWPAFRSVLQKFFWLDSFEEKWKECWEIAKKRMKMEGRRKELSCTAAQTPFEV